MSSVLGRKEITSIFGERRENQGAGQKRREIFENIEVETQTDYCSLLEKRSANRN